MTEELSLTGKCMCGAIEISASARKSSGAVCHCDMCRRWSAGPFMAVTCQSVIFSGEENIGKIRASDRAERGFCTKCGSNLYYRLVESTDYYISAGLFDDQSTLRLSLQVFMDSKPQYYAFSNETLMFSDETKRMTAEEVTAVLAPSSD